MMSTATLLWGMVFGSIGLGFFLYGKKQKAIVPLVVGLTLFVFPYFISDVIILVTLGIILIALPYFIKI
ncbi:hypothetical protein MNBD_GAMMA06-2105 [hydrothermal vent metagenome]|uniref:Uncharacterized protein n=1 Tax=hydrothermal vent metagenome TaxID=652676 RepID=A0A3B0W9J1_9ZZZZ